jgi:exodeoxyribonuclease V beta subunit
MQIFDPFSADIKSGTTLIEASAGTGKTYTITSLVLRLVLEKGLSADEILVVTFTEAAASELKDRILKRLRETLRAFESFINDKKEKVEDPFIYELVNSYPDLTEGMDKISCVIRNFDLACIFTIHGFCCKILFEHAFETGNFFDSEIISDEYLLIRKSADDFYRKYIDSCSLNQADILFSKSTGPETIAEIVKKYMSYPETEVIAEKPCDNFDEMSEEFIRYEKEAASLWKREQRAVRDIVTDCSVFKKNVCDKFEERKEYLDKIFGSEKNLSSVYTSEKINGRKNPFWYFRLSEIEKNVKSGKTFSSHEFFEKCENLYAKAVVLEEETLKYISWFKKTGFEESMKILAGLKDEHKVLGFGDFLFKVKNALENNSGQIFKAALRKRYKAALIDEFQDTDTVQYEIFKKIFKGYAPLFFIGDPKQAIYRFRGADIYAYLDARKDADHIFTLNKNYRSSKNAVNAVNNIFSYSSNPFSIEEIGYIDIGAVKPETDSLFENKKASGGVDFVLVSEDAGKTVAERKAFILKYLVSEITGLLSRSQNNDLKICDEEIKLSDIAVLVNENQFGREIRKYLEEHNIQSVLSSEESVFDTEEAKNILEFLDCAANPSNERKIKKVLTGGLFLMSASDLNEIMENESKWADILNSFKKFDTIWTGFSVMEMLNSLYYEHNILNIQARLDSGERRVTNLLHIFEILHEEEVRNRHGKKSLINWLAEKIENKEGLSKEYQLRMESDKKKLKIMTVHKSKGLEFPIVFCAFLPKVHSSKNQNPVLYHDEKTKKLVLDFCAGLNEKPSFLLNEELVAEDLRLFYVALTRAKYKTYVFINEDKKNSDSYAARLFKGEDGDVFSGVKEISQASGGCVNFKLHESETDLKIHGFLSQEESHEFKRCIFEKELSKSFQISSFSLVSGKKEKDDERFDSKIYENTEPSDEKNDEFNIFNFPKGAYSGIFFHSVFEDLKFNASDTEIEELVKEKLQKYGFGDEWLFCVFEMVKNVLNKELEKGLFLKNIPDERKITELEFYYPLEENEINSFLKKIVSLNINDKFRKSAENISASKIRGFMKGFVDLVFEHENKFYILDWKSNHLGFSYEDYREENLLQEICDSRYFLQYYIYSYALDKYLKYRLGGKYSFTENFGGVYYLFLRGIESKENKNGIFYDLPLIFA